MARAIATVNDCEPTEDGKIRIIACVTVIPEAGETFEPQKHLLDAVVNGTETNAELNTAVENGIIANLNLLGITITRAKLKTTRFA